MTGDATPGSHVVELELPPRPEVVSIARLVVGSLAAADPMFDEERGADLRLAVSEACTNAIQAQLAAGEGVDDPISMRFTLAEGHIEVVVTDHGGGFDPAAIETHPAVTDPARLDHEGGLGIPLIKMLADEIEFGSAPRGTTVTMRFRPRIPGPRSVLDGADRDLRSTD